MNRRFAYPYRVAGKPRRSTPRRSRRRSRSSSSRSSSSRATNDQVSLKGLLSYVTASSICVASFRIEIYRGLMFYSEMFWIPIVLQYILLFVLIGIPIAFLIGGRKAIIPGILCAGVLGFIYLVWFFHLGLDALLTNNRVL